METDFTPFIGMPVGLVSEKSWEVPWVGWVRRINWEDKLAEVLPETRLADHAWVYRFDQLKAGTFTKRMHYDLPKHIEMVQSWVVDNKGKILKGG